MLSKTTSISSDSQKGLRYVGLAFLFVLIIAWHIYLFIDMNYRQDEIVTVHAAYAQDYDGIIEWLKYEGTHPVGWTIYAVEYLRFFGVDRSITRFQSALFTLITLASIYQLGKQLFDYHLGIIAVTLFGFFEFTAWHTHELRPYAPLLAFVTLVPIMYLRWFKNPTRLNAFWLFVMGALAFQVHFYAALTMITLFLFTAIYSTDRPKIIQLFGIFTLVALSLAWWLPALYLGAFVTRETGIYYAFTNSFASFLVIIWVTLGFPVFSLGIAFLSPHKRYPWLAHHKLNKFFRHPIYWRHWLLFSLSVGGFLLAWFSNYFVSTLSIRNLLIFMPFYCLSLAYLINHLSDIRLRYFMATVLAIELIIISAMGILDYHFYDNIPLEQMEAYIDQSYDEKTAIVTEINLGNRSSETVVYFLMDNPPHHPSTDQIFSIAEPDILEDEFFLYSVDRTLNKSDQIDAQSLAEFEVFLLQYDRVWYIEFTEPALVDERPIGDAYRAIVNEHFTLVDNRIFEADEVLEFDVQEYIRK